MLFSWPKRDYDFVSCDLSKILQSVIQRDSVVKQKEGESEQQHLSAVLNFAMLR